MKIEDSHIYERVILAIEVIGFSILLAVLWLDEYVDVPFRFFGALKTPLRPQEFWFEVLSVLLVATAVISATLWVFRRLRIMEGFIQVCAWCRKVNVADEWVLFEQYLKLRARRAIHPRDLPGVSRECRQTAGCGTDLRLIFA